jgi:polysaccharide deacetylase 2 family uncharacterized protein YibQ
LARKARKSSARRGRPRSRLLLLGVGVVLLGVVIWLAQNGPSLRDGRGSNSSGRSARGDRDRDSNQGHADRAATGTTERTDSRAATFVDSDWDRLGLRFESEYLRLIRPGDHAALLRLTSRTLRGALEEIGVSRALIDERPLAAAAAGAGRAPVQWRIQVPPRASLYRINDAITQAMILLGGRSIRGSERPAQTLGTALDLRVGYGDRVTHAIVVEPSSQVDDADAKIAFVVLDADPQYENLYRSYVGSGVPFTFAVRPDLPVTGRVTRDLRRAKREIFLHLAMEPRGYPRVDPGKDAILLDLSQVEIEDRIARGLSTVNPARGVVSRLGGAAVNDADVMRAVLGELKRRNIPFVDAHGGGPSVVQEIGEEVGARTLTLGATLDGSGNTPAAVRARLKQLVQTAVQRGALIVTLHPSAVILGVLEDERDTLRAQGVDLVPASEIVL